MKMKRWLNVLILLLLMALVVVHSGKFLGYDIDELFYPKEKVADPSQVSLDEARMVWSDATAAKLTSEGIYEVRGGGALLGFVMKSSPYSDQFIGYMGPVPLLIALDADGKVLKVLPLDNDETPSFMSRVSEAGLFDSWSGMSTDEAASAVVDAVSGATFSSRAIIQGMQYRMEVAGKVEARHFDWRKWLSDGVLLLFVLLTLWAWLRPQKVSKCRRWILLAAVLILGIWQGRMLSMAQFTMWLMGGIPLAAQWLVLLIFLLAVLLPMITGKAYYCAWLCPMGAAQSLLGEVNKKHKLKLSPTLVKWLQILRTAILLFGLLAIGIGLSFDFADIEAFTIFRPQSAPIVALVLAILSLVLSIFVARPWCRFLCPLGEMLEMVRKKPSSSAVVESH
ncbi:MAG: 4Fe-4S binding protein [Bacteroidales bacterium]|nr:4Fe-4S binding protein [Bacteroidales bacterium]